MYRNSDLMLACIRRRVGAAVTLPRLSSLCAALVALTGLANAQIDPRAVDKLSGMGRRPLAFFSRENSRVDIDVSAVVRNTSPERLVQTAAAFPYYAAWRFPIVSKSESLGPYRTQLTFHLLGFTTIAVPRIREFRVRDNGAALATWNLAGEPAPRDFHVFAGSAYAQPLGSGRVYFRYRLSVESAYTPPEWLMTLVFDTLGRKFARDAVKALLRAAENPEPARLGRP